MLEQEQRKKRKKRGTALSPLSAKQPLLMYKAPRARYPNTRGTTLMLDSPASVVIPVALFP